MAQNETTANESLRRALADARGIHITPEETRLVMRRLLDMNYVVAPLNASEAMYMSGGNTDVTNQPPRAQRRRIGDMAARNAWRTMMDRLVERQEDGRA